MGGSGRYLSRRQVMQGVGLAGLVLLTGCGQLPGQAPPSKVARIGLLGLFSPGSQVAAASQLDAFRQGMRDLGYVEGHSFTLVERYADGNRERYQDLAAELVRLPVDVIVVSGAVATRAVKQASDTIPIVMVNLGDPVGTGLVASLDRPAGNVTGVSGMRVQLSGKRLELLRDAVVGARRFGALWDVADESMAAEYGGTRVAAQDLGVELHSLAARGPDDFDRVYAEATGGHLDGLVVIANTLLFGQRTRLVDLALRHRLPTISSDAEFAAAGGLMSYGPNPLGLWRRGAYYVDRILRGTKPADLPIEQPTKFDLVLNLKTAQVLGLTIPRSVLEQATEVIQ